MGTEEIKVCNKCEFEKPLSEYYARKDNNGSYRLTCKQCISTDSRQKRLAAMSPEQLEKFLWRLEQESYLEQGTKKCSSCFEIKALEDYQKATSQTLYAKCSSCRPEARREYFTNNPLQQIKRHQGVLTNREFVKAYTLPMKEAGCADCKKYYPDAMEFDHTCPPSEKLYNIAKIHSAPGSSESMLEILEAELAKGEYVCVNCHTIRTYSRQSNSSRVAYALDKESIYLTPIVKAVYRILADSCCVDCSEDNFLLLEFDHVRGKKIGNVSLIMKQTSLYTLADIEEEINKCEVRCGNCHRIKTKARQTGLERNEQIPRDIVSSTTCVCGNKKDRFAISCLSCYSSGKNLQIVNTYGELETLIQRLKASNFTKLGKELGVTDNAIRKHLRRNGIDPKTLLPMKTDENSGSSLIRENLIT